MARAALDPTTGRERSGRRPVVVPVTTVDRGWPNHVVLEGPTGLERPGWAMTEQPRTIDRGRLREVVGQVDAATAAAIDVWLRDFLALA